MGRRIGSGIPLCANYVLTYVLTYVLSIFFTYELTIFLASKKEIKIFFYFHEREAEAILPVKK